MGESELPKGWAATTLDNFTQARGNSINPAKYPNETFELYSVPSFDTGAPVIVTGKEIGSSKQLVKQDSVLLSKINPRINRSWVVESRGKLKQIASTEWIVFPPSEFLISKFLCFFLRQSSVRDFLAQNVSGVGGSLMRVKASTLKGYQFQLPPLNEQRRIVEKIETLFAELDKGEEALREVQKGLTRYRQSVLKAAVTGELTADWRAENAGRLEHGRDLLARILETRRDQWQGRGKYKEPVAPDTSDLPELPDGWVWASGGQLFAWSSGKFLPNKKQVGGDVPVYGGNGIHGYHDQHLLAEPTMVVGRVGAHCGNVHLTEGPAWITDNAIYAMRLPVDCELRFLTMIFEGEKLGQKSKGGAQPFVNQEALNSTLVSLPSAEEQKEIMARLNEILSNVKAVEEVCETELARSAALRQSILKDAFTGRLVPQDPTDEPAAELLARIKAEREAAAKSNKKPARRKSAAKKTRRKVAG